VITALWAASNLRGMSITRGTGKGLWLHALSLTPRSVAKMESFKDTVLEQYQAVKQLFRQPRMVRGRCATRERASSCSLRV